MDVANPFCFSEISPCFFISERSMCRKLRERGLSYLDIKRDVRMAYAKYFLFFKEVSVKDVSKLVFFKSPNSFVFAFKSYFGVTPKEWTLLFKKER